MAPHSYTPPHRRRVHRVHKVADAVGSTHGVRRRVKRPIARRDSINPDQPSPRHGRFAPKPAHASLTIQAHRSPDRSTCINLVMSLSRTRDRHKLLMRVTKDTRLEASSEGHHVLLKVKVIGSRIARTRSSVLFGRERPSRSPVRRIPFAPVNRRRQQSDRDQKKKPFA